MLNDETTSELCRVCGEASNKFVKAEGIYRSVIFDLLSEISNLQIKDDDRLPTSICCSCSNQLQQAKSALDKVKSVSSQLANKKISLQPLQCRGCLGPVQKHMAVNIYDKQIEEKLGKSLADIFCGITDNRDMLHDSTSVCRSCSDMLSSFYTIKSLIISSNAKFCEDISTQMDPLSSFVMYEEYLDDADNEKFHTETIENPIESPMFEPLLPKIKIEPDSEVIINELTDLSHSKIIQQVKVAPRNANMNNCYAVVLDEVIVKVDRSNKPVHINPINEKKEKPKTQKHIPHIKKYKCLKSDCDLLFFTKVDRFYHMRVESHMPPQLSQERQFYCYCGLSFNSKKEEDDHIRQNHNIKLKCNTCGKVSFSRMGIQRHITHEHGEGKYTATLLTKFKNDSGLDIYRCSICNLDNTTIEDYNNHCQDQIHIENSTYHYKERWGYYEKVKRRLNDNKFIENPSKRSKTNCAANLIEKTQSSSVNGENSKIIPCDPKLAMNPCVSLLKLPNNTNRVYSSAKVSENTTNELKGTSVFHQQENESLFIKSEPIEQKCLSNSQSIDGFKYYEAEVTRKILAKVPKPLRKSKKKKSAVPIISSVASLHPNEIAKKIRKYNPPPPPPNPTPENIDPNFEFLDHQQILCKTCNRQMHPSYYHIHIKSKLHSFLIAYPQFRNEKTKRQQKLSEGQIFVKMRLWCDVCRQLVYANFYERHTRLKGHKFYLENPDLRLNKSRITKTRKINLEDDVLSSKDVKIMICDYCRKGFRKKHLLIEHIQRHCQSNQIYNCILCDQKFFTSTQLLSHARNEHTDADGCYNCELCNKKTTKYRDYVRHCSTYSHLLKTGHKREKVKLEKKSFTCFICDIKFTQKDNLTRHWASFHAEEGEPGNKKRIPAIESNDTICKLCQKQFTKPNDLQVHYILDHDKNDTLPFVNRKPVICNIGSCGKMLHRSLLKAHCEDFHPASLLCHVCGKNFDIIREFRYHRDYGHLQYMICDLCGKFKSQSKARLWKHMSRHIFFRDERNKKFFCEVCGYTCFFKSRLDKHLWTHGINVENKEHFDDIEARRKFKCDQCDKSYVDRKDLRHHKMYKHEGIVQPFKFLCEICGFKFYKRNKYLKHLNSKAHLKKAGNISIEN